MVTFPGAPSPSRDEGGGNRKQRRAAKKKLGPPPRDAVVSLTPQGRAMFGMLLQGASDIAGRQLTGEDLLEAMRRVRAETGIQHVDFKDPTILECYKKHLREIGAEGAA
jgi:hypothetical protein